LVSNTVVLVSLSVLVVWYIGIVLKRLFLVTTVLFTSLAKCARLFDTDVFLQQMSHSD